MASSATAVVVNDRPAGHLWTGSFTLDPASAGTLTAEVGTVTVPGVAVGDVAYVNPRAALTTGLGIHHVRCSANTITIQLFNASAGTIDQASGTWDFVVFRGSTMGLR
jgi:hypothetical protein